IGTEAEEVAANLEAAACYDSGRAQVAVQCLVSGKGVGRRQLRNLGGIEVKRNLAVVAAAGEIRPRNYAGDRSSTSHVGAHPSRAIPLQYLIRRTSVGQRQVECAARPIRQLPIAAKGLVFRKSLKTKSISVMRPCFLTISLNSRARTGIGNRLG